MTAKELKIREVYGDKYDQCQPDENGWTDMYEHHPFEVDFDDYDMQEGNVFNTFWRPKSLSGIEYNNGWNRIDEVGLPNKGGKYKFISKSDPDTVLLHWFFKFTNKPNYTGIHPLEAHRTRSNAGVLMGVRAHRQKIVVDRYSAKDIQNHVMGQCRGSAAEIIIPNYYQGRYEMDVFRLMPSGIVVEYEIKISRSDFKNDFKKGDKHASIAEGKGMCNRFFFVVPKGLVLPEEVPKHAGLIYFDGFISIVKNAPLIKGPVFNDFRKLAINLSYREQNLRYKLRQKIRNARP